MSKIYNPDLKRMIPMFYQKLVEPEDFTAGEYKLSEKKLFFGTFRTYGGTEINESGIYDVIDTANIVTWYNRDITRNSVITMEDGREYDVISEPENIFEANQYMKFKVKRRNSKVHAFDIARLDKKITFVKLKKETTKLHQIKYTLEDYMSVFANVEKESSNESNDVKTYSENTFKFIVRYHKGKIDEDSVTQNMKIRYRNEIYDILGITNVKEANEYLKIAATIKNAEGSNVL